ncbi:MAG: ribosome maturation factor RimM [Fluviicola sp.]|jgi:16S rRNA processing protein RimM|nr:ribosome maturation factor RimM [Fluviicola sp.]
MNKADCFHLGYVAKLHGFKGEVSLFLDVTNPEDYIDIDNVFIDINNQLTPFFIESFKLKNHPFAAVKFEGINSEMDAKIILRKNLYLPSSILKELEGNNFYDHEVVGYKVIDEQYGEVGILESIIDLSVNPLIQVMNGSKEVLIPLLDDLVKKVDRDNKTLHINAPTGLISLYLD